jgi:hypothetical protein
MKPLLLALLALSIGACNTVPPPPPVPRVPAVTLKPISDNNAVIRSQNKALSANNDKLRDSLDRAIVTIHQARLEAEAKAPDPAKLTIAFGVTEDQIKQAKAFADAQKAIVQAQAEKIDAQDVTIAAKQGEVDNVKRIADKQSQALDDRNAQVAKYEAQERQDEQWFGLHGVFRWLGHFIFALGWRIALVAALLIGVCFLINAFAPGAIPILKGLAKIPAFFLSLLQKLNPFKPKPPT